MKILFYGTKNYDEQFFEKLLPEFPDIKIKFIEANIHEETASLAKGYEAICAFVNADLGAPVIEELHQQGVKLILMRCAGYNNVDLKTAHKYGMKVLRVPGYSPEAVAEHAMALALTANRHTHKAYIKCREITFGYTFPTSMLGKFVRSLSVSFVARNPFIVWKNIPNIDPDSNYNTSGLGLEYGSLPSRRSYGFNVNVKF